MKRNHKKIARLGLVANFEKSASRSVVLSAAELIRSAGRTVAADAETSRLAGLDCAVFATPAALAAEEIGRAHV